MDGTRLITSLTIDEAKTIVINGLMPFMETLAVITVLIILYIAYRLIIYPFFRKKL